MGININIPAAQTLPLITENQFSATFNAVTPGLYDWDGNTVGSANNAVKILDLEPRSVYIIERINFSANMDEGDFKDVQVPGQALNIWPYLAETQNKIILDPIPFINYYDNLEVYIAFKTNEEGDELLVNFNGQLGSNFNIAGKLVAVALLQLNIYRIQSTEWVRKFDDMNLYSGDTMVRQ